MRVRRGGIYIPKQVYDLYFAGLEAVILLRRDADLLILPVRHSAAGGYLLKVRNAAGDRLVFARDFLRENGCAEDIDREFIPNWENNRAGLSLDNVFSMQI